MPSNIALLLLAVSSLNIIIRTADSFECFPREKETEKPVGGYVQVYCKLDDDLQSGESFNLEKNGAQIGQCSYKRCRTAHPYDLQLPNKGSKNITFEIGNLSPENSGEYFAFLKNKSSVLNRVLVLNLTVNQNEPTCDINLRHDSLEMEVSCEAMLYSSGETTIELTLVDNGTEVHINSHSTNTLNALSSLKSYSASSTVKFLTSLNAFLTGALRPIKCLLGTKQGSYNCYYPIFFDFEIVMTKDSEVGCGHMVEVWLVSTNLKTLKLHLSEPTIIDASMADVNSFILICGIDTRGLIEIRTITKMKVMEHDICYTANVKQGWLQTTVTIIHGCVSTTQIDRSSYRPAIASSSPEQSLTTKVSTDNTYNSTDITTSVAQSNTEVRLTLSESTTKSHDYQYLKYATLLSIVASVTILFTITTCLYLARLRMNVNGERNLGLRYYRYDPHRGEGVATERRDNQAVAPTTLATSNSIHSLQGCRLNVSQVQHVDVDDDYTGDVTGVLVNRPALPPRGHVEASDRKRDCHTLPAELNKGGSQQNLSFVVVTPTCQRVTWCPSKDVQNQKKGRSATDELQDSESIYHTVKDMNQGLGCATTTLIPCGLDSSCSFPGTYADLRNTHDEIEEVVEPVQSQGDQLDIRYPSLEANVTIAGNNHDISVEDLYAKPNKKGK